MFLAYSGAGVGREGMLKGRALWALGTMSGTSLDGVDGAMVLTDGRTIEAFGRTAYRPYSEAEREVIRAALGRWPDEPGVAEAAAVVEDAHAALLAGMLAAGGPDDPQPELIGFHGQTLAHDPAHRRTHQTGDGGLLAEALGLPVVWDFRSSDVALGGQGAPLVPFFHHALARYMDAGAPVAFLNLGGVGNVTWVDPRVIQPEAPGAVLAFDTGPANAPLNDLMRARLGAAQDKGGALSRSGQVAPRVLRDFLDAPYFYRMPPKSLDRNDFHGLLDAVADLSDADAAATLTACAAAAVARGADHFPAPPARVYVAGGGRHNRALMAELTRRLPFPVAPIDEAGLDGDMLEAQAFAYLAVRVLNGLPTSAPSTTGVAAAVGGGRFSPVPAAP